MSRPEPEELTADQERQIDALVRGLDAIEPSPQFEARFRARLARAEEPARSPGVRAWWRRGSTVGWLAGAAATGTLAVLLSVGDRSLPEEDWEIVSDPDAFELLVEEDLELLASLDVIEAWDGSGSR